MVGHKHSLISNAEQGDLDFRTNYWSQTFPGSTINVYEWVSSTVPPEQYAGEGIVKDITKFTTANVYDSKNNATFKMVPVQGRRSNRGSRFPHN